MRQKGVRSPWQETKYREAHELLEKTLVPAINGMTKTQLHKKTRLSRSTIDRHLEDFIAQRRVDQSGLLYYWGTNLLIELERSRLILDILDKQEKADRALETKVAIADATLKGDALNKRIDEIYLEELGRRAYILRKWKEQGVEGASEKEEMVKAGIKLLRQLQRAPPGKGRGILEKYEAKWTRKIAEEEQRRFSKAF